MLFGLVDQGDAQIRLALEQAGGRADACCTGTNDHDGIVLHALGRRLEQGAALDAVCQVEPRGATGRQHWLSRRTFRRLIHGPEIH